MLVAHDRHLLGLVCDSFWRVADGHLEPFDGDLDEYAAWLRSRPGSDNPKTPAPKAQPVIETPSPAAKKAKGNPHKLQKAEAQVVDLEEKLATLARQLADPKVYDDPFEVKKWGRKHAEATEAMTRAEALWMKALERLERAERG